MTLLTSPAERARCEATGVAARSSAAGILHRHLVPDEAVQAAAAAALDQAGPLAVGRVASGGRWQHAPTHARLQAALPAALASYLRAGFEWYACRGACFHNDAHYGQVLFGAWCIRGPEREIVFSRLQMRCDAAPGGLAVFDPFEPHAVLDRGCSAYERERYAEAAPSVFLGFEVDLAPSVREYFGIGAAPAQAPELSSRVPVHAETGRLSATSP